MAVSEGTPVGAGLRADDLAHTPPSRDDVAEHGPGAEDSVNVTRMSNRPLPDQSAFDGSFARNSHVRPQEKAACPPTPVRAPPRQAPGGLQLRRFDSLQETKTLLEPGDDGMLLSPEPLAQDTSGAASAAAGGGRPTPGHPSASVQHHQRSDLGASRDSSNSLDDCDVIGLVDGSTDAPGHAGSRDSWLQVGSPHHPDGAACSAAVRCSSRGGGGASSPSAQHGGGAQLRGRAAAAPSLEVGGGGHRRDFVIGDGYGGSSSHGHGGGNPSAGSPAQLDRTLAPGVAMSDDDDSDADAVAADRWDGDMTAAESDVDEGSPAGAEADQRGRNARHHDPASASGSRPGSGRDGVSSLRIRVADAPVSPRSSSMLDQSRSGPAGAPGAAAAPATKRQVSLEGSFFVLRELGRGSFSRVFEVVSKADGERYAVKQSLREMRSRRERAERLREVMISRRLGVHANIVDYLLVWQEDSKLHVQMELCAGGSFVSAVEAEMLRQAVGSPRMGSGSGGRTPTFEEYACTPHASSGGGGFWPAPSPTVACKIAVPESTIWAFIAQVAAGLHHMHEHGFVHLDIKPENVLVTRDGTLKLGDLGVATEYAAAAAASPPAASLSDSTAHNSSLLHASVLHNASGVGVNASFGGRSAAGAEAAEEEEGDSRYMAPELLGPGGRLPPADIFSLGISAFQLAWDIAPPVEGQHWQDLRRGELPPLPGLLADPERRSPALLKLSESPRKGGGANGRPPRAGHPPPPGPPASVQSDTCSPRSLRTAPRLATCSAYPASSAPCRCVGAGLAHTPACPARHLPSSSSSSSRRPRTRS